MFSTYKKYISLIILINLKLVYTNNTVVEQTTTNSIENPLSTTMENIENSITPDSENVMKINITSEKPITTTTVKDLQEELIPPADVNANIAQMNNIPSKKTQNIIIR